MSDIQETKCGREAILRTIAFFDMFDYPMTAVEIWKYLGRECELGDVMAELQSAGYLEVKHGFYFFPGRAEIVFSRNRRYNYANRKFKRALRVARLFKIIPWIRLIAVGNQIGINNLRDDSDIDFFIITEPHRIWITRWFCAGIAQLLRMRPEPGNKRDKICLSFYISSDDLEMEKLMLPFQEAPDMYFVYWLAHLVPIYDRAGTYLCLLNSNSWLKRYLPNWTPYYSGHRRDAGPGFSEFYRDFVDMLIGGAEALFKKIQLHIMPDALHRLMNIDTRVVVNDRILKLYINDHREELRAKYLQTLKKLGI